MRSPWDYSLRTAEFLAWLDSLDPSRVLNPPALIRWNFDKRYLLDLEAHGVSIVPTIVASSLAEVRAAAEQIGGRVVIKPNIGAGSWGAHLTSADDPKLDGYAAEVLDSGKLVLVEPEIPEITAGGERGLLFFDGVYSHTITKGRILADDGGYLGGEYTEDITPATPTDAEVEMAARCSRAIAEIAEERGFASADATTPLYARYDIVTGADGPMVIEAELFEPCILRGDGAGECGARGGRDGGTAVAVLAVDRSLGVTRRRSLDGADLVSVTESGQQGGQILGAYLFNQWPLHPLVVVDDEVRESERTLSKAGRGTVRESPARVACSPRRAA